jgi:hypothetical protein
MQTLVRQLCAACLVIFLPVTFLVFGQEPPVSPPKATKGAVQSRDNFGPKDGTRKRLSSEEFDKATEKERQEEKAAEKMADSPAATRTKTSVKTQTTKSIPPHRLTRDATLHTADLATASASRGAREFQITLKNAFIEKYKNRATLTTPFRVIAHTYHAAKADGDAHVSGLPEEVGLACVAEIMNVKDQADAKDVVEEHEGTANLVNVTGVWRLWCEHPDAQPGDTRQIQDDVIPSFTTSNPRHVFELHPVTRMGQVSVLDSLKPIHGYDAKDATKAFQYYESITCRIVPDPETQTTTLFTKKVGYNYVDFKLETEEDEQFITLDGLIVRGRALTLDEDPIVSNRRMVFVHDSAPEKAIRGKPKGTKLHVLGIPRVDLALVSYRARVAASKPEALEWNLPYEIVIVGVYDE